MFGVSRRDPGTIQDSRCSKKCQNMHLTNEHSAPPMIVPKNDEAIEESTRVEACCVETR